MESQRTHRSQLPSQIRAINRSDKAVPLRQCVHLLGTSSPLSDDSDNDQAPGRSHTEIITSHITLWLKPLNYAHLFSPLYLTLRIMSMSWKVTWGQCIPLSVLLNLTTFNEIYFLFLDFCYYSSLVDSQGWQSQVVFCFLSMLQGLGPTGRLILTVDLIGFRITWEIDDSKMLGVSVRPFAGRVNRAGVGAWPAPDVESTIVVA